MFVEESRLLETYLAEAEGWMWMVGELMPSVRAALEYSGEADSSELWEAASSQVVLRGVEEQMAKVKRALAEGLELGLDLAAISELEALLNVNMWSMRALQILGGRPELEVIFVQRPGALRMWQMHGMVVCGVLAGPVFGDDVSEGVGSLWQCMSGRCLLGVELTEVVLWLRATGRWRDAW